jgi:hypothetical protein
MVSRARESSTFTHRGSECQQAASRDAGKKLGVLVHGGWWVWNIRENLLANFLIFLLKICFTEKLLETSGILNNFHKMLHRMTENYMSWQEIPYIYATLWQL